MIDLIIFDLDGVLIDTEHIHYSSLCNAINKVTGISYSDIKQIIKTDGSTTKNKLRILQSVFSISDEISTEINRLKQESVLKEFTFIQPNIKQIEMLSLLSKRYKLAIGSNSRKSSVDFIVDALNIRQFFTHVVAIDDVESEKPNPEIFNYIMNLLNIFPKNTIILEDSIRGIEAVNNSGAHLLVSTCDTTTLEYIEDAIRKIEAYDSCTDGRYGIEIY